MKRTIIQLPEETFEAVRRVAFERGRSISDVIREAISDYLAAKAGRGCGAVIRWQDIVLTGPDGDACTYDHCPYGRAWFVSKLRQFRNEGGMDQAFFQFGGRPHENPDDASTWGPESPDEIDWTGFPESPEA